MKKFLIITNLLTLAGVVYLLVPNKPDTVPPLPFGYPPPDCSLYRDYNDFDIPGLIDIRDAMRISGSYERDKSKKFIEKNGVVTGEEDARSARFSVDQLKSFIWKVERNFCGKNCRQLKLGIRFYYAKYPDEDSTVALINKGDWYRKYAYRHTLFMVPTYFDAATNKHVDFDPFYPGDVPCKPTPFTALIGNTTYMNGQIKKVALGIPDGDEDNHGGLMPPPAGIGTFPTN